MRRQRAGPAASRALAGDAWGHVTPWTQKGWRRARPALSGSRHASVPAGRYATASRRTLRISVRRHQPSNAQDLVCSSAARAVPGHAGVASARTAVTTEKLWDVARCCRPVGRRTVVGSDGGRAMGTWIRSTVPMPGTRRVGLVVAVAIGVLLAATRIGDGAAALDLADRAGAPAAFAAARAAGVAPVVSSSRLVWTIAGG